jgi:membrane protein required for colicin V production
MNILDIIILICLIPAVVQGLRKGFISQAISIISLIAGIWASARFAGMASEWLAQHIDASEQVLRITAFARIMVAVFIVLALIGKLLEATIKLVMLGWVNRLLGMCFALVKCLLILGLLALGFNSLNNTFGFVKPEQLADSVLYPIINDMAEIVFPYLKSILTLN